MRRTGAWRIGGYVADELIGHGASAQVWRGRVARTGEPVALKVLDLADAGAARAARHEAALLSALDHPHLVRLRELLPDGDCIVLVLELATGGSLDQVLRRRTRLSPGEVVTALSPIAAALAYAHDQGVVHSDVSPANVLFRADGSPVLADLGVARLAGGFDVPRSTFAYADPGVAAGGMPSAATDVFMVAATALHALTGHPPWAGPTPNAVLASAAAGVIERLDARLLNVPPGIAAVIRRGLSTPVAERGTAAEFALELRHAATPVPVDISAGRLGPAVRPARVGSVATNAGSVRARARGRSTSSVRVPSAVRPGPRRDRVRWVTRAHGGSDEAIDVCGARYDDHRTGGPRPIAGQRNGSVHQPAEHVPRHAARIPGSRAELEPAPVPLERPGFARPDAAPASDERRPIFGEEGIGLRVSPSRVQSRRSLGGGTGAAPADESGRGTSESEVPLPLTHIVRARARPIAPAPSRRLALTRARPGVNAVVAVVVAVVLVAGGLAWLRWGPLPGHAPAAGPPAATRSSPADPLPTGSPSTGSAPTTWSALPLPTGPRTVPPSGAGTGSSARRTSPSASEDTTWTVVLTALDRHRQRAFATGNPAPLSSVYVPGSLREQDESTLHRVVPPGCRLMGLRTDYRRVHGPAVGPARAVVAADVSLESARLECPRQRPRRLAPHAAVPMTLVLLRRGSGYLIGGITLGRH